jgi:hypothetical protein
VRLFDLPRSLHLLDDELGVGAHSHPAGAEGLGRDQARDQGLVLGHVVGRDTDALTDLGQAPGRVGRGIEHHRADRRRSRVAARTTVAIDEDLFGLPVGFVDGVATEQRGLGHGTRIAEQLSQYEMTLPDSRRTRSASVDGIVR